MMPSGTTYASTDDIADRLGRELDDSETMIVETRLADAEEILMLRIPDLMEKVTSGKIRERLVVMVECEAVMRLIRNPDGMTSEVDGTYSYRIDPSIASGRLSIEPEEWAMLGLGSTVGVLRMDFTGYADYVQRPKFWQWFHRNTEAVRGRWDRSHWE